MRDGRPTRTHAPDVDVPIRPRRPLHPNPHPNPNPSPNPNPNPNPDPNTERAHAQTPRVWLNGYDEGRQPLTPAQALQDISHEHARKTVTIDPHPHASVQALSLHPCQHGARSRVCAESEVAAGCCSVQGWGWGRAARSVCR